MSEQQRTTSYLAPGTVVLDLGGERIGTVRAVYPHYLAVDATEPPPAAFRVPIGAIDRIEPHRIRLSVSRQSLDAMSGTDASFDDLPERGAVVDPRGGDAAVPDLRAPEVVATEPAHVDAVDPADAGADLS